MLPITLRSSATCAATKGDALSPCCCKARTMSRRPAASEFFLPPFVSTTLLQRHCLRGQRVYSGGFWCQRFLPTQAMPEAFLPFPDRLYPIPPPGFVGVTRIYHNFFGHSKHQIVGSSTYFPGIQNPPTPSPYAST